MAALAGASREQDPYTANVLATEAHNRIGKMSLVMRTLTEGVVALDSAHRVTYANPAAERLLGWAGGGLVGRDFLALIGEADGDDGRAGAGLLGRDGRLVHREATFTRHDGRPVEVAFSAAPIVRDGEVAGAVVAFGDITERRRSREKLRQRVEQLQALHEMSDAVVRAPDLVGVYDRALDGLERTVGTARAAILLSDAHGVMRFKRWRGLSDAYRAAVEGHSPWPADATDPQPILVEDVRSDESLAPFLDVILGEGIHALAFVPLVHHGRLLGKLMLYFDAPRPLPPDDVQLARTIASSLALAIARKLADEERSDLLDRERAARIEARAAAARAELLADASRVLAQWLEYWTMLPSLADLVVPALADVCIIDVVDENGIVRRAAVASAEPIDAGTADRLRAFPPAEGAAGPVSKVMRTGRPELCEVVTPERHARLGSTPEHQRVLDAIRPTSYLVMPLRARGRTIGALTFLFAHQERRYSRAELPFFEDLASRTALAVDNARLYREARSARLDSNATAARAAVLGEVGRVLTAAPDETTILSRVAAVAIPALADWCAVHVLESDDEMRLLTVVHKDSRRAPRAVDLLRAAPPSADLPIGAASVVRSGRSVLFPSVKDTLGHAGVGSTPHLEALRQIGLESCMIVPVVARGRVLATFTFALADSPRRFTAADVAFAEDLARRTASAVDGARLYREAEAARAEAEKLNHELARRVVERTRSLELANRELEMFSYTVSHDLRAPLRAIDFFSRTVLKEHSGALDKDARELLERLRGESGRLTRLVNDLLALSRIPTEPPLRERVDLAAMARDVVNELTRDDPARRVDVRIPSRLLADCDPRLMRLVLDNLIGNAWKFTADAAAPFIEFGVEGNVFFVRDNGAGFDMAHADKLFRPFQRLHPASEFAGSGIGLASVRRIVELHEGHAWARGAPGKGAVFFFTLGQPAATSLSPTEAEPPREAYRTSET